MRRLMLGLSMALTAGIAAAAPVPPSAEKTLSAGNPWVTVSQAGEAAAIHGAIDIDASPQKVWAVLVDCAQARKVIANLTVCRVTQKGPGWDVREQVSQGNMFVPTIRNLVRADYTPYSRITFRKVGGDLKTMQGEWRLEARGKGTRVIYENRVAADIKLPAEVVRAGMKTDCGKVLVNLRRAVTGR
ncbi:MAG: SRPBCC family protein [Caulobacter sp.]|nr:SRPBCC family protein [Caulobacter sp.]